MSVGILHCKGIVSSTQIFWCPQGFCIVRVLFQVLRSFSGRKDFALQGFCFKCSDLSLAVGKGVVSSAQIFWCL